MDSIEMDRITYKIGDTLYFTRGFVGGNLQYLEGLMTDTKGVGGTPALGVSVNMQFAAGRQVVFQTHLPQECSVDELNTLLDKMNDRFIHCLYKHYRDDPMIKWKDSIKQIVGLERSTVKGLDA